MMAALHVNRTRVARMTAFAMLPLLVVVAIYGPPYARSRHASGPRDASEIAQYSAQPADYLRVPPENRLRGRPDRNAAPDERSLFPGIVALVFAAMAFWPPVSRTAWLYGVLAVISFVASLGANGVLLLIVQRAAPIVTSLRSPARFGVLVALSVALLAALSAARLRRARTWGSLLVAIAVPLSIAENYSAPLTMRTYATKPSPAHQFLATLPSNTVVLELPMPTLSSLWLYETTYQVRSITHWKSLINGYSGFVPAEYARTLEAMRSFPDDRSVRRLKELGLDVILVNRDYYDDASYAMLMEKLNRSKHFETLRVFGQGSGEITVMTLRK